MRQGAERRSLFAEELSRYGERLRILSCDVNSADDRKHLKEMLEKDFASSSLCLVNNAGIGAFGAAEETSEATLRTVMETNFFSVVQLTQDLLPMLRSRRGHIITVSSVFGTVGFPLTSLYCASKHAVEGFMESLSYELSAFGVRVSLVEPGGHRTGFMPNAFWQHNESSSYATLAKGYRAIQHKLQTGKPTPPDAVCKRIVQLASMKYAPLRSYVGNDARVTLLSHALIPRNFLSAILRRVYPKMLGRMARKSL